jgi:Co/Zn/Cd efflux system component
MKHCCEDDRIIETDSKHKKNRTLLKRVLFIQVTMCLIAIACGISGHSSVALADSVDFLSHVFLLAMSLYATGHGVRWIGRASLLKGISMTVIGFSVLLDALQWGNAAHAPSAHALGIVGVLGLLSNMATFSI